MGINTESQIDSQPFRQTTSFLQLPRSKPNSSKAVGNTFAVQNSMDVYAQYTQKLLRNKGDFKLNVNH